MAVKSREEILNQMNAFIGENASDDALALIEDFTDTYDDMSSKVSSSGDWENKYKELDKTWRDRYKERFFNGASNDDDDFKDPEPEPKPKLTFEDLFTTK